MKKSRVIIVLITMIVFVSLIVRCSNKKSYKNLWFVQADNNYTVGYKYNENELIWFEFSKAGINELIQISKIFTTDNQDNLTMDKYNNQDKVEFIDSYSDWIGPYIVRHGFKETQNKKQFTGGWHGVDDKYKTARMIDYNIKVDGNIVDKNENKIQLAKEVVLSVTNNLYAYNTLDDKEEVLQETVIYNISYDGIQVEVIIKALDDIVIERYYGMQTLNSAYKGNLIYGGDEDISYNSFEWSNSPTKLTNSKHEVTIKSEDKAHVLISSIDKEYGLGKCDYLDEKQPYAFTLTYGKTYFNLVNGKELFLKKDESARWKGKYIFKYDDKYK